MNKYGTAEFMYRQMEAFLMTLTHWHLLPKISVCLQCLKESGTMVILDVAL